MSAAPKFKNNVKISERHGAGEWKLEKALLLLLMPLSLWVASTGFTLAGADAATVAAWFANKLNIGLAIVTALAFFGFAYLAWKVIIEDYVPAPSSRKSLSVVALIVFVALAAASIFFIVRAAAALAAGA
ncbi:MULTISPECIES: succinate dehydrogenase [unclassified Brevundimonas]|uniref:succinate dehydrogenase n=1 Tax=unclassified Brevundimonas TaxID=2622653 RepID=UPI0025C6B626|nr:MULTISPECIES: succinate dehydrogenase [unclassified Brevundimonas]